MGSTWLYLSVKLAGSQEKKAIALVPGLAGRGKGIKGYTSFTFEFATTVRSCRVSSKQAQGSRELKMEQNRWRFVQ